MINGIILLFIALANIIAILLVYYSFGKNADKSKKLINTMIAVGIVYILVSGIYLFSSLGIPKNQGSGTAKTMITMAFMPVNTIIVVPLMIRSYIGMKNRTVSQRGFKNRVVVMGIIVFILIIAEFIYFRSYQNQINERFEMNQQPQNKIEDYSNYELENTVINEINNEANDISNLNNEIGNKVNEIGNIINEAKNLENSN